jgi:hypothetical protein
MIEFPGTRKALIVHFYPRVPNPPETEQLSTAKSQMKLPTSASISCSEEPLFNHLEFISQCRILLLAPHWIYPRRIVLGDPESATTNGFCFGIGIWQGVDVVLRDVIFLKGIVDSVHMIVSELVGLWVIPDRASPPEVVDSLFFSVSFGFADWHCDVVSRLLLEMSKCLKMIVK